MSRKRIPYDEFVDKIYQSKAIPEKMKLEAIDELIEMKNSSLYAERTYFNKYEPDFSKMFIWNKTYIGSEFWIIFFELLH